MDQDETLLHRVGASSRIQDTVMVFLIIFLYSAILSLTLKLIKSGQIHPSLSPRVTAKDAPKRLKKTDNQSVFFKGQFCVFRARGGVSAMPVRKKPLHPPAVVGGEGLLVKPDHCYG